MFGPDQRPKFTEPIAAILNWYYYSDLVSASFGIPEKRIQELMDTEISTETKWPVFEEVWLASQHTAYARVTKLVLRQIYGVDIGQPMTRQILDQVAEKLPEMDEKAYFRIMGDAKIKAILSDVTGWLPKGLGSFLDGTKTFPSIWKPLISLPGFHPTTFTWNNIQQIGALVDQHITSLDEFLESVFLIFEKMVEKGAVGIKDQSAYDRVISYDLVTRSEAEKQFNQLLSDPRNSLGWPDHKPLNDYLFHEYMRFARELDLPVQLHTGHMAGNYNRVDKTNAAGLASVLELHKEVRFDLFHGNWPYLGDLLFLGKNYPNVALDLCWLHIIDPIYSIELMERAVLTMPHTKIHAFGGDFVDLPEFSAAHLQIARMNIAAAMTHLIEGGWFNVESALSIARDWLFNNPNRFFNLGLD
jgi:hypothetical protein